MPRLYSAAVLGALALALTWSGVWPFCGLVMLAGLAMCWEWGRLVGTDHPARRRFSGLAAPTIGHGIAVAAAAVLTGLGMPGFGIAVLLAAALAGTLALDRSQADPGPPFWALGVLYVGLTAVSLIWLRADPTHGLQAVLLVFLAVWTTDIAAYVAGRTIGGARLAPRISPGKTWSGLAGGVAASALACAAFVWAAPDAAAGRLGVLGALLAVAAQAGDLAESALKRRFGVKDASQLIPGHGGILDRVDGLVTAAIVAAGIGLWLNPAAPGRALLTGF